MFWFVSECCPWSWSWLQQSCRCPRSWKLWKKNLQSIKNKHLIQPWTLKGHDSWYLLMFFHFYLQVGCKWPSKNDFSLCVGLRWRSNTLVLSTLSADAFLKIHHLNNVGVCGSQKYRKHPANADEFHNFFSHTVIIFGHDVFLLFSHVAALQSKWQTGIQFDGLWFTLISCQLVESQSVIRGFL